MNIPIVENCENLKGTGRSSNALLLLLFSSDLFMIAAIEKFVVLELLTCGAGAGDDAATVAACAAAAVSIGGGGSLSPTCAASRLSCKEAAIGGMVLTGEDGCAACVAPIIELAAGCGRSKGDAAAERLGEIMLNSTHCLMVFFVESYVALG